MRIATSLTTEDASMGTEAPTIVTIPIHCAPKKAPCPQCGKHGCRKRKLPPRLVRTVVYQAIAYLEITCGEYQARCECCTTFRNTPEGVLPRALYDNKVRDLAEHRRKVLDHFSGTLCVDELHLGQFTLLLATDPISDLPVAFALVRANDSDHMRRFLQNLKNWGFLPQVVITDGSNLYPKLLAELWPHAQHQLCVFHVLQDLNGCVLDALRRLRRQL